MPGCIETQGRNSFLVSVECRDYAFSLPVPYSDGSICVSHREFVFLRRLFDARNFLSEASFVPYCCLNKDWSMIPLHVLSLGLTICALLTSQTMTSSSAGTYASFPSQTEFELELQVRPNAYKVFSNSYDFQLDTAHLCRPMPQITSNHVRSRVVARSLLRPKILSEGSVGDRR